MVSRTRVTRNRRAARAKQAGKKRKAQNRNKGSTPAFSIHPGKAETPVIASQGKNS